MCEIIVAPALLSFISPKTVAKTLPTPGVCCIVSVTKCAVGKKFVAAKKGDPAECQPCPSGTFNANNDASTQCTEHNPCTDTTVKEAGTASKDAVCNPGIP